jgi:hypothetical protein
LRPMGVRMGSWREVDTNEREHVTMEGRGRMGSWREVEANGRKDGAMEGS